MVPKLPAGDAPVNSQEMNIFNFQEKHSEIWHLWDSELLSSSKQFTAGVQPTDPGLHGRWITYTDTDILPGSLANLYWEGSDKELVAADQSASKVVLFSTD